MRITLSSPAFEHNKTMPAKYTCYGIDVSPPLVWSDPPAGTESFVFIVKDQEPVSILGNPTILHQTSLISRVNVGDCTRNANVSGRPTSKERFVRLYGIR